MKSDTKGYEIQDINGDIIEYKVGNFADDQNIATTNQKDMNFIFNIIETFLKHYNMSLNIGKCEYQSNESITSIPGTIKSIDQVTILQDKGPNYVFRYLGV